MIGVDMKQERAVTVLYAGLHVYRTDGGLYFPGPQLK